MSIADRTVLIGTGSYARQFAAAAAQAILMQPSVDHCEPRWELSYAGGGYKRSRGFEGMPGARKLRAKRKVRKKMRQQSRKKK